VQVNAFKEKLATDAEAATATAAAEDLAKQQLIAAARMAAESEGESLRIPVKGHLAEWQFSRSQRSRSRWPANFENILRL